MCCTFLAQCLAPGIHYVDLVPLDNSLLMGQILKGALRGEGPFRPPSQLPRQTGSLAELLTFVCISVSLLLIPDFASGQGVGSVLSEEGDHVAAGGSQRGVQGGRDAELNHRPVTGGGTVRSEEAVAPREGAGAALR